MSTIDLPSPSVSTLQNTRTNLFLNTNLPIEIFLYTLLFLNETEEQKNLSATSKSLYNRVLEAKKIEATILYKTIKSKLELRDFSPYLTLEKHDRTFIDLIANIVLTNKKILDPTKLSNSIQNPIEDRLLSKNKLIHLKYVLVIGELMKTIPYQESRNLLTKKIVQNLTRVQTIHLTAQLAPMISSQKHRIPAMRRVIKCINNEAMNIPDSIEIIESFEKNERKRKRHSEPLLFDCMSSLKLLKTTDKVLKSSF